MFGPSVFPCERLKGMAFYFYFLTSERNNNSKKKKIVRKKYGQRISGRSPIQVKHLFLTIVFAPRRVITILECFKNFRVWYIIFIETDFLIKHLIVLCFMPCKLSANNFETLE